LVVFSLLYNFVCLFSREIETFWNWNSKRPAKRVQFHHYFVCALRIIFFYILSSKQQAAIIAAAAASAAKII